MAHKSKDSKNCLQFRLKWFDLCMSQQLSPAQHESIYTQKIKGERPVERELTWNGTDVSVPLEAILDNRNYTVAYPWLSFFLGRSKLLLLHSSFSMSECQKPYGYPIAFIVLKLWLVVHFLVLWLMWSVSSQLKY